MSDIVFRYVPSSPLVIISWATAVLMCIDWASSSKIEIRLEESTLLTFSDAKPKRIASLSGILPMAIRASVGSIGRSRMILRASSNLPASINLIPIIELSLTGQSEP